MVETSGPFTDQTDQSTESHTVLVVEDNEGLRNLIEKRLRKSGYQVTGVGTGAEALAVLESNHQPVLLLDQKLPDMSGSEVVEKLRQQGRLVPFVVMTGQGDERLAVEIMKQGARDYLIKGVDLLDQLPGVFDRLFQSLETEQRLAAAEAALRESEQRYREAQQIGKMGHTQYNFKDDSISWSDEVYRIFEIPTTTPLTSKKTQDYVHPDDITRLGLVLQETVARRGSFEHEHRIITGQNRVKHILYKGMVQCGPDGTPESLIGVVLDITERKQAEEEIKYHAGLIASLLDAIPDIVFYKDVNGIYIGCNTEFAKHVGLSKEQIIGKPITIFIPKKRLMLFAPTTGLCCSPWGHAITKNGFPIPMVAGSCWTP